MKEQTDLAEREGIENWLDQYAVMTASLPLARENALWSKPRQEYLQSEQETHQSRLVFRELKDSSQDNRAYRLLGRGFGLKYRHTPNCP